MVWVVGGENVNKPAPQPYHVAKTPQTVHANHPFREGITTYHPVLSEIWEVDCDSITINFVPQILTEKKGRWLDVPKCFLFLRIREFVKFKIFVTWGLFPIPGFDEISAYSFILRDKKCVFVIIFFFSISVKRTIIILVFFDAVVFFFIPIFLTAISNITFIIFAI